MALKNIIKQSSKFLVANIPIYGYAILLWLLLEAIINNNSSCSSLEQHLSIWLLIIFSSCLLMLYIKAFEGYYEKLCHILKKLFKLEIKNQSAKTYNQTLKGRTAKLEGLVQKKVFVRQAIAPFIHTDIARRKQAGEKLTKLSHSKVVDFIRDNYENMPPELQPYFIKIVSPEIQQQGNVYSKEVYEEYKKILDDIKLVQKQL